MKTSEQFNEWLTGDSESIDYSTIHIEQFKIDLKAAIKDGLFNDFIDSISSFPKITNIFN